MSEPRNYPDFMTQEAERERDDALKASGYRLPIRLTDEQLAFMREGYARRAGENAATRAESARHHTCTYRGRQAAERSVAAARAQLERSKETA